MYLEVIKYAFDKISIAAGGMLIRHLTEPAALYVLWPVIALIILAQLMHSDSKESAQSTEVTEIRKVELFEEHRIVNVDAAVETEPISIGFLKNFAAAKNDHWATLPFNKKPRQSMIPKERFYEEQTTFVGPLPDGNPDSDITLENTTLTSFVCKSDKSLMSLPKIDIHIVKFKKEDFKDGIGLVTAVKGDSLVVKKVLKGSAACGRICSGDRITAVNGNSLSISDKCGELMQSLLDEAIRKQEPFEITIVIGSRLKDLDMTKTSCSFMPSTEP